MLKKIILSLFFVAAFAFAADPITIEGRLTEIPGKMPSNDLYSYVYVFKYKVTKVVSGKLDAKDVLVGVYNPLIARGKVKDKMADKSKGNVGEFKAKESIRSSLSRSKATGTALSKTNTLTTNPRAIWQLK